MQSFEKFTFVSDNLFSFLYSPILSNTTVTDFLVGDGGSPILWISQTSRGGSELE